MLPLRGAVGDPPEQSPVSLPPWLCRAVTSRAAPPGEAVPPHQPHRLRGPPLAPPLPWGTPSPLNTPMAFGGSPHPQAPSGHSLPLEHPKPLGHPHPHSFCVPVSFRGVTHFCGTSVPWGHPYSCRSLSYPWGTTTAPGTLLFHGDTPMLFWGNPKGVVSPRQPQGILTVPLGCPHSLGHSHVFGDPHPFGAPSHHPGSPLFPGGPPRFWGPITLGSSSPRDTPFPRGHSHTPADPHSLGHTHICLGYPSSPGTSTLLGTSLPQAHPISLGAPPHF